MPGGGCGVFTSVSGSAPNRVFNVEWRAVRYSNPTQPVNFEVRLYENGQGFDFVYGQVNGSGGSATIGVQNDPARSTQFSCNTASLSQGLLIHWSLGGCAISTPTNSPTGTGTQAPTGTATLTLTRTASPSPSNTNTPVPSTSTSTSTNSPTVTGTATPTRTPTGTASFTLTRTASPSPSNTGTPGNTATNTPVLTATRTHTATSTSIATPRTGTPTATVTGTPCDSHFSDVSPSDYFYEPVRYLYCHGAVSGYGDGTFRPYNNTTRGQLTKIVVLAEGWGGECPATGHFSDVPPTHPFFCFVEIAFAHGIISGYADHTFHPNSEVLRGQLCKIVVLAEGWQIYTPPLPTFRDVLPGSPFYELVETAYYHGIISGYSDGTFRPSNSATRGQIAKIVYRAVTQP